MEPPGRKRAASGGGEGGFTLLELILATLISALIVGVLSVSLAFCLRLWERHQHRRPDDTIHLLEFLNLQIGQLNTNPVRFNDQERPVLLGGKDSLVFATNHSLKAASGGVPVIARYVFVAGEKRLYYAEIPLVSNDPELIEGFLKMEPGEAGNQWPMFYPFEVEEFSLVYAGRDINDVVDRGTRGKSGKGREYEESWEYNAEEFGGVLIEVAPAGSVEPVTRFIPTGFLDFNALNISGAAGSASQGLPEPRRSGSSQRRQDGSSKR